MTSTAGQELLAPSDVSLATAIGRLGEALQPLDLTLAPTECSGSVQIYLDTFDGRLGAAGLAAVHTRESADADAGRIAVIERNGRARVSEPLAVPTAPLLAVELSPGPLRDTLLPIVDVRALLPVVELQLESTGYAVYDGLAKTVARITVEAAWLGDGTELSPRLRVQGLRGYTTETEQVAGRARRVGFTDARRGLREEAVLKGGGSPGGTSSKVGVELLAGQRSDAAAVAILRRLLEVIESNLDGTIADLDAEFLHDLRVAVRRSRAVQRELRAVFAPAELSHFRAEFRWLQGITGPARDFDVYVLEFATMRKLVPEAGQADLDPVLQVLRDRRDVAHRAMVRDLRSARMTRLCRDWDAYLEELVASPLEQRPQAQRAIGALAGARIVKVYTRILKLGGAIDADSPAEAYHEVRKQGKELRYLLELFGTPLFDSEVVKPMIRALKALQDVLGRHQDRDVQQATLREIGAQVSTLPGRAPALMAMGVLLERLHADELAARDEFAERFAAFSTKPLRKQVKRAFRP